MLINVEGLCWSPASGTICITRPSAGATTTLGSAGGTRFGSLKKKHMKAVMTTNGSARYQNPSAHKTIVTAAGIRI